MPLPTEGISYVFKQNGLVPPWFRLGSTRRHFLNNAKFNTNNNISAWFLTWFHLGSTSVSRRTSGLLAQNLHKTMVETQFPPWFLLGSTFVPLGSTSARRKDEQNALESKLPAAQLYRYRVASYYLTCFEKTAWFHLGSDLVPLGGISSTMRGSIQIRNFPLGS